MWKLRDEFIEKKLKAHNVFVSPEKQVDVHDLLYNVLLALSLCFKLQQNYTTLFSTQ
jgi:hypothetical protein